MTVEKAKILRELKRPNFIVGCEYSQQFYQGSVTGVKLGVFPFDDRVFDFAGLFPIHVG
ncbi:hypothetical protein OAL32_03525 [Synechococcus sp. AH-551-G15]|nr:hypothetical protein [Synechococcus sp. AH-551-G15]